MEAGPVFIILKEILHKKVSNRKGYQYSNPNQDKIIDKNELNNSLCFGTKNLPDRDFLGSLLNRIRSKTKNTKCSNNNNYNGE